MVIFHGYVKLPEGNMKTLHDPAISLGLEDHVVLCLVIRQGQTVHSSSFLKSPGYSHEIPLYHKELFITSRLYPHSDPTVLHGTYEVSSIVCFYLLCVYIYPNSCMNSQLIIGILSILFI